MGGTDALIINKHKGRNTIVVQDASQEEDKAKHVKRQDRTKLQHIHYRQTNIEVLKIMKKGQNIGH